MIICQAAESRSLMEEEPFDFELQIWGTDSPQHGEGNQRSSNQIATAETERNFLRSDQLYHQYHYHHHLHHHHPLQQSPEEIQNNQRQHERLQQSCHSSPKAQNDIRSEGRETQQLHETYSRTIFTDSGHVSTYPTQTLELKQTQLNQYHHPFSRPRHPFHYSSMEIGSAQIQIPMHESCQFSRAAGDSARESSQHGPSFSIATPQPKVIDRFSASEGDSGNLRFGSSCVVSGEFAHTDLWSGQYNRNNKRWGLKNLRCFPHCTDGKHKEKGFCGAPIKLMLSWYPSAVPHLPSNEDLPFFVWIEFCKRIVSRDERRVQIGQIITRELANQLERSSSSPYNPWIVGAEVLKVSESDRKLHIFEFHHEKRGWHYGFVANKHLSNLEHCVRAYVFTPVEKNNPQSSLCCCSVITSPSFTITCRRRGKQLEEEAAAAAAAAAAEADSIVEQDSESRKRAHSSLQIDSTSELSITRKLSRGHGSELESDRELELEELHKIFSSIVRLPAEIIQSLPLSLSSRSKEEFHFKSQKNDDSSTTAQTRRAVQQVADFLLSETELTTLAMKILSESNSSTGFQAVVHMMYKEIDLFLRQSSRLSLHALVKLHQHQVLPTSVMPQHSSPFPDSKEVTQSQLKLLSRSNFDISIDTAEKEPETKHFIHNRPNSVQISDRISGGTWEYSQQVRSGLARMYSTMGLAWFLRECLLFQESRFTIQRDYSTTPWTVHVHLQPKLFSDGSFTCTLDGKPRPFTLDSPLILCKNDALHFAADAFETGGEMRLVLDCMFDCYRLRRVFTHLSPNRPQAYVKVMLEQSSNGRDDWVTIDQVDGPINQFSFM